MVKSKSKKNFHKNSFEKFVEGYVGKWAFALGIIFAFALGFLGVITGGWIIFLIVIGLIIGLLNVTEKETTAFLISGVILVIISVLGGSVFYDIPYIAQVLDAFIMIFVPATVIVAAKSVFNLAKD